jgi:hypothetical protein
MASRSTSLAIAFALCLSLAALAGCGGSVTGGDLMGSGGSAAGGSGGSTGGSGGSTGGSAGQGGSGGGYACGPTTCPHGEYCCNADCGMCAPIGAACAQVDCAPVDAGPPPMPCGNTTCASGSICCNVCGADACVQGNTCPTGGACAVDCSPEDAHSYGKCKMLFGYRWNGVDCEQVGGCSCQGTDCGNLFKDLQSCYQAYASCPQYYN